MDAFCHPYTKDIKFIACIYINVEIKYLPEPGIDHKEKESKDMLGFYTFGTMVTVGSEDQYRECKYKSCTTRCRKIWF